MGDDGQEPVHAKIVVDQEAAGRAFFHEDADVPLGLRVVRHVDHR